MADHLAVLNMPMQALQRSATVSSFDPLCGGGLICEIALKDVRAPGMNSRF